MKGGDQVIHSRNTLLPLCPAEGAWNDRPRAWTAAAPHTANLQYVQGAGRMDRPDLPAFPHPP